MTGRILGPNISFWNLVYPRGGYIKHQEGCGGRVLQNLTKNYQPVGRAYCQKCERLIGKKAWYQVEKLIDTGRMDWNSMCISGESYARYFTPIPEQESDEPREVVEIQVPAAAARKLRSMSDGRISDILREAATGILEEPYPEPGPRPRKADWQIKKGPFTMAIPHRFLTYAGFRELQEEVRQIPGEDVDEARLESLVEAAIDKSRKARAPLTAPIGAYLPGKLKKKAARKKRIRKRRRIY